MSPSRRGRPSSPRRAPPRRGAPSRAGGGRTGRARGATSERRLPAAGPRTGPRGTADNAPRGLGGEQVEGRQAVRELLAAGRRAVREVWIAEDLDPSTQIDDIERLAGSRRVRLVAVSRARLERAARTEAPQGVLAYAAPLEESDLDALCAAGPAPFLLVLDGVTDPHNVGSLLRSAECAGVTGIVLPRHRAAHVTATVAKVAAGAIEHLEFAVVSGIPNALRRLHDAGVTSIGLDADAGQSLFEVGRDGDGAVALVLGSEGRGLAPLTRRRCSALVSIPQFGTLAALNVAAAGAVACFELARRRVAADGSGAPKPRPRSAAEDGQHHGARRPR